METLDEVISTMEYEAAYNSGELRSYDADALHYLKEYRSDQIQWEADRKNWQDQYAQAVENFKASTAKHLAALKEIKGKNEPLTWDELRTMQGGPVWVELLKGKWKGWDVIGGFDEDDFGEAMVTVRGDDYYKLDLSTTWQAYRKERS